jgi:hypothetical protein
MPPSSPPLLQLPSTESRQVKCLSPPLITGNLSPGPRLLVLPKTHRCLSLWKRTALLPRLLLRRSVRLGNRYHDEFLYSDVLLIFKIMYLYIYRCHSFWFAIIHCRKHRPKSRVILRNSARNTASSSHSKARSTKSNFYAEWPWIQTSVFGLVCSTKQPTNLTGSNRTKT